MTAFFLYWILYIIQYKSLSYYPTLCRGPCHGDPSLLLHLPLPCCCCCNRRSTSLSARYSLDFFVFALWAVPALWLCDCIDLQSSALARQFVCLVMWFFRINTDACLKVRYLFMYLKTVEVSTQHCWLLSISIFLYKSSSMQGSLLGIWLIWAVLLKVPQKQDVLMRTLLLI